MHPRNLALNHARGPYIAFQNSDDEWQPTKLALQIRATEGDSTLSACFTAGELIGEAGQPATGTWADGLFTTKERLQASWLRHFFDIGNCLLLPSGVASAAERFRPLDPFDGTRPIPPAARVSDPYAHRGQCKSQRPHPSTVRRAQLEHAVVLERYLEKPLLDMVSHFIEQREIGTLRFIARPRGDRLDLLVHAKAEPGNVGIVQLAPTRRPATVTGSMVAIHPPFLNISMMWLATF